MDLKEALCRIPAAAVLAPEAFDDLLHQIYLELEIRVGNVLSQGLTDAQLAEFESILTYEEEHPEVLEHGSPATAWLEAHRPDYPRIVRHAIMQILAETRSVLQRPDDVASPHHAPLLCASTEASTQPGARLLD
jgi:hypothetical protein